MKLFSILAVVAACGGPPAPAKPQGDPLPATAPLPPTESADGVYVDPDAQFSIKLPPGRHFVHGSNPILQANLVTADVGKASVTVMVWKPPHPATVDTLDSLIHDTNAAAVKQDMADISLPNAAVGRFYRYDNPATDKVQGHGEVRAFFRDPWIYIVIVFVQKDSPFEPEAKPVLDSFKLL